MDRFCIFWALYRGITQCQSRIHIKSADNKGSVYGVFYAGVALFGALGAYVSGLIWEHFGMDMALEFSLGGTLLLAVLFILLKSRHEN